MRLLRATLVGILGYFVLTDVLSGSYEYVVVELGAAIAVLIPSAVPRLAEALVARKLNRRKGLAELLE